MAYFDNVGQEYIYHIEINKKIYIGQSTASKEGSRLYYRLRAAFGWKYDVPELAEEIRKVGLKNVKVVCYNGPNFGVSPDLMASFKKVFKQTKDGKEVSDINAAEILHILYYQHKGYKLFNTQMGGSGGSLSVVYKNQIMEKMLTKTMTPAEAHEMFFADIYTLQALKRLVDEFNDIVFTNKWEKFIKDYRQSSGAGVTGWASMTYEELINNITNKILNNIFSSSKSLKDQLAQDVTKWIEPKKEIFQEYLKPYLKDNNLTQRASDIFETRSADIDKLIEYIVESIWYQLINKKELKREFRDIYNVTRVYSSDPLWKNFFKQNKSKTSLKNTKNLKKTITIIRISALFDLQNITHKTNTWWGKFDQWVPSDEVVIREEEKKEISLRVFNSLFRKVSDSSYYNNKSHQVYPNYVLMGWKHKDEHSLSSLVRKEYEALGIKFVENVWTVFYSKMISVLINKGITGVGESKREPDPWQIVWDEYLESYVSYRTRMTIDTEDGEKPVGHKIKRENIPNWSSKNLDEIDIY